MTKANIGGSGIAGEISQKKRENSDIIERIRKDWKVRITGKHAELDKNKDGLCDKWRKECVLIKNSKIFYPT